MKFDKMKPNILTGHNVWIIIHKKKQTNFKIPVVF